MEYKNISRVKITNDGSSRNASYGIKNSIKKLLGLTIILSLLLSIFPFSACTKYANAEEDAVYTQADAVTEVAYAYYRQQLQQNYNQTMSRRNINTSPEEATSQHMIFLDCSSYVNAVIYETFGVNVMPYETTEKTPQTLNYMNYAIENSSNSDVLGVWECSDYTTEEEKSSLLNSIRAQLQVGDVIDYRTASAGHSLIYVGNDTILHSTGNDFESSPLNPENSNEGKITKEANGTVQLLSLDRLFSDTDSNRYLFKSGMLRFCVLRPMARGLTLTENTTKRMLAKGLDGEKTLNVGVNTGIAKGQEITYTLTVKNHRDVAYKNVEIKDVLDDNLTFVSGSDGVSCSGQTVTFNKEIKSGETITLSWTAKVKDTAVTGAIITSNQTTVAGVKQASIINSVVGYSASQLQSVADKAKEYVEQGKEFDNPIDMVESIYKDALNVTLFDYDNLASTLNDILDTENATLTTNNISKMVAPNLYGGQSITKLYRSNKDIIRLITTQNLSIGDVIIAESDELYESEIYPKRVAYVYVGDMQVVACTTRVGKCKLVTMSNDQYDKKHVLVTIFAYNRYAVLRPSQVA